MVFVNALRKMRSSYPFNPVLAILFALTPKTMQHPRGVSIILGIGVALGVFVLLVVGAMVYGSRTQEKSTTTANANVGISDVVKLDCTQTSDCAAYCGLESTYTPYCDSTKHCTCSYSGEPVPSGNANIAVTDFVSCATAGNPVQESYPRKCSVGGVTFTEVLTNSNVNSTMNTNQSTNTNVSIANWETYFFDEQKKRFYQTLDGKSQDVTTPFTLADYHGEITLYGALFWKEGATKTTTFAMTGDQKVPYENGVLPNFYWYSFTDKKFTKLPVPQTWKTGDKLFDRVFAVHQSNSEERVMIEVGEYDIAHKNFEPGLIGQEPVKTRGLLYIPITNTFGAADVLTSYLSVLNLSTTQWHGFIWDSKKNVAVAVPGGEGCGAYSFMIFVDLTKKTEARVGSSESSWGGYDYAHESCNPHNGRSPNEQWVYLYGKTASGKTTFRLFSPATQSQVLRTVTVDLLQPRDYPKIWDYSKQYPKAITEDGVVIDFNT